jgi:hypothetical protein
VQLKIINGYMTATSFLHSGCLRTSFQILMASKVVRGGRVMVMDAWISRSCKFISITFPETTGLPAVKPVIQEQTMRFLCMTANLMVSSYAICTCKIDYISVAGELSITLSHELVQIYREISFNDDVDCKWLPMFNLLIN